MVAHPGFILQSIVLAPLIREREDYVDSGVHFYWFANQQIGPVNPLLDRVQSGLLKHSRAADYMQVYDAAFLADSGLHNNGSLDVSGLCDGWIFGSDPLDEIPRGHAAGDGDLSRLLRGRVGGRKKDGFVDGIKRFDRIDMGGQGRLSLLNKLQVSGDESSLEAKDAVVKDLAPLKGRGTAEWAYPQTGTRWDRMDFRARP